MTWAYAVRDINHNQRPVEEVEDELNILGTEGWEMISTMQLVGTTNRYFFKRSGSVPGRTPVESLSERLSETVTGLLVNRDPD